MLSRWFGLIVRNCLVDFLFSVGGWKSLLSHIGDENYKSQSTPAIASRDCNERASYFTEQNRVASGKGYGAIRDENARQQISPIEFQGNAWGTWIGGKLGKGVASLIRA